ncbi:MAG: hypothetical protein ABSH53_06090 [Holophaga sp.]
MRSSKRQRAGRAWAALLALPGLLGCAGASGGVALGATDPDAVRLSPAGSLALAFLDLQALRPDLVLDPSGLPPCVQGQSPVPGTATYTFAGCPAANTGTLSGTVTVTGPGPGGEGYLETLDLSATATLAGAACTWTYRGSLRITVAGGMAHVALAEPDQPVLASFATGAAPAAAFAFTPTDLNEFLGSRTLFGSWQFVAKDTGDRIAGAIQAADPLVWDPARCPSPVSGTQVLTRFPAASPQAVVQTPVSFDQGCGRMTVGGLAILLGTP